MKPYLFLAVIFVACAPAKHTAVTAPARTAVTQAATATTKASEASQRSSQHIREFKNDAERIDYKAQRALQLL